MSPLKLKIRKPSTEQFVKGSSSKSSKRRKSPDDDLSDMSPSSSDREDIPFKTKDVKTRDTPTLSRRPTKKRRVVSDDDYEDGDLTPLPEERANLAKMKRETKGKAKASTSAAVKNERQQALKLGETNTDATVPVREEQEKKDKAVSEVFTSIVDMPPRKKLPTIKKKTKPPGAVPSASGLAAPSTIPSPSTKASIAPPPGSSKEAMPVTTLNPSGSGDFDLRDSNTWQSLLGKKTANSGPRVGIEKRVSTQERRQQLEKMREEARTLRNEQLKNTFDLQAQSQKISRFEKSFAHHEIQMQGPHILGAAFKDKLIVIR